MPKRMPGTRSRVVPKRKIRRTQEISGARTEAATFEPALDVMISEQERNRLAWEANERFIRSGVPIRDVYGKFED